MSTEMKAGVTVGDVLNHVVARAKEFGPIAADQMMLETHMNAYRGPAPSRELVNAIIVSFVNYFAASYGCDLALYTTDIPEVPPKGSLAHAILGTSLPG